MTRNMGTWIILLILSAVSSGVSAWDVSAKSTAGRRLLKNAQKVEYNESGDLVVADRRLEDQQQAEDDDDDSWVAHMSLKFDACYNTVILSENGGQNGQSPIVNQGVVTFRLCQSYNCDKCSEGGIYAIDLAEFVSAYSAAKMEENQYTCQSMLQSCGCYNADDEETCAYKCWQKHGLEYCFYDDNFQFENYLECAQMEVNNNQNNNNQNGNYYYQWQNKNQENDQNGAYSGYQIYPNWNGNYYVGPYCAADGESVYLGVFYDEGCSVSAGDGAYATMNYAQLPYSASSKDGPMVPLDTCMYCTQRQQNGGGNNNNNNNQAQVSEFCAAVYEDAAKCNANDSQGCHYIKKFLPKLNGIRYVRYIGAPNNNVPLVFAILFLLSTVTFGGYSFYLYAKIKRGEVEIYDEDDEEPQAQPNNGTAAVTGQENTFVPPTPVEPAAPEEAAADVPPSESPQETTEAKIV